MLIFDKLTNDILFSSNEKENDVIRKIIYGVNITRPEIDILSEDVKIFMVRKNKINLRKISKPSMKIKLAAFNLGDDIEYYSSLSKEEFDLIIVRKDSTNIRFIEEPSELVQLEAVKNDGTVIQFIKTPTFEVSIAALNQNIHAAQFLDLDSDINLQLIAVKNNGMCIEYIENPSEEIQLEAVKNNGMCIEYIEEPSELVQLEAVKNNGIVIHFINEPSEKIQLEAVKQSKYALKYITNKVFYNVELESVKHHGFSIIFANNHNVNKLFETFLLNYKKDQFELNNLHYDHDIYYNLEDDYYKHIYELINIILVYINNHDNITELYCFQQIIYILSDIFDYIGYKLTNFDDNIYNSNVLLIYNLALNYNKFKKCTKFKSLIALSSCLEKYNCNIKNFLMFYTTYNLIL